MPSRAQLGATYAELPLLAWTQPAWSELAARNLPLFLADHAVCELQAALTALNLVAHYPEDGELVERMSALAAEEVSHLRRVTALLHRRGLRAMRRRANPYVQALRKRIETEAEPRLKIDRLVVGALIEARSCERFTRLLEALDRLDRDDTAEREVADLLADLGPAEKRHWQMFHRLAARDTDAGWFAEHWRGWLEYEARVIGRRGNSARVHG